MSSWFVAPCTNPASRYTDAIGLPFHGEDDDPRFEIPLSRRKRTVSTGPSVACVFGRTQSYGRKGREVGTRRVTACAGPLVAPSVLVKEFTPAGTLVQVLNTTTGSSEVTGSAFDSSGNFYVTGLQTSTLSKFDNSGTLLTANLIAGHNPVNNESLVFDNSGNFYVGGAGGNIIREFTSSGTLLNTFTVTVGPRGTDWIDLAADQHTIFYTSEGGSIRRFDTATNTQLPDFTNSLGGESFALRLLPDGGALVA